MAIGTGLGVAMGNIAFGSIMGVALGAALGGFLAMLKAKSA